VSRVRTALYLDFDNVFGGVFKIDPEAAIEFAESPGTWLAALENALTVSGPRRWLVLRCYMNPAGWVPHASAAGDRLYFSRFRPSFTQAGFEVIDCPRLSFTKNAADIRLVLDAVDAMSMIPAYDEFVIASGDSDMTPLLVRLRAADRRTTILSPSDAAEALTSVADRLIGADQVLALIQGEPPDLDEGVAVSGPVDPRSGKAAEARGDELAVALKRARDLVVGRYASADEPLNLSQLASQVSNELADNSAGGLARETRWFGSGSFAAFLMSLELEGMQLSQHYVWDSARHVAPSDKPTSAADVPAPAVLLTSTFNLPRLAQDAWGAIYEALADYAATHEFNLSDATRWGRDRLVDQGIAVSRAAIGVVIRAAAFGGAPLYDTPSPTADRIGSAFVKNLLDRAAAAEVTLSDDDVLVVQKWFGGGSDD